YLADKKGIVPFLKVDKGLADEENGVQVMKPIPNLDDMLKRANERHIFGTKMRSVIKKANEKGIKDVVDQQFEIGKQIIAAGLVPIGEPEVDIHSPDKEKCEEILKEDLLDHLNKLGAADNVILWLTIATVANIYKGLREHPRVLRVVAESGGSRRADASEIPKDNANMIASFSRALSQDLNLKQTEADFDYALQKAGDST